MGCLKLHTEPLKLVHKREGQALKKSNIFLKGTYVKKGDASKSCFNYYPYGAILREYVPVPRERYLTTHHERDSETDLDYRGARLYDSDVGRFLSLDPDAEKYPGWSSYNYTLSNPIRWVDPTGKGPEDPTLENRADDVIANMGLKVTSQSSQQSINLFNLSSSDMPNDSRVSASHAIGTRDNLLNQMTAGTVREVVEVNQLTIAQKTGPNQVSVATIDEITTILLDQSGQRIESITQTVQSNVQELTPLNEEMASMDNGLGNVSQLAEQQLDPRSVSKGLETKTREVIFENKKREFSRFATEWNNAITGN